MTRKIIAFGVCVFGCSMLWLTLNRGDSKPSIAAAAPHDQVVDERSSARVQATSAHDERALNKLSQRVNQLQIDHAALRAQLVEAQAGHDEQVEPHDPVRAAAEANELEARDRARTDSIARTFDQFLDQEGDDPSWSPMQESSISTAFADGSQGKLLSARCGSTLCKLELLHTSTHAAELFVALSGTLSPFLNSKGFYRYEQSDQGVKMAFYAARQGHDLPPL